MNMKEIIDRITPDDDERKRGQDVAESVKKALLEEGANPILVGSLAKDTDLSGAKDIDIFIQFEKDTSRDMLEREGLRIGKKALSRLGSKYEIDYAEHPYVRGVVGGFDIEIVPCYRAQKIMSSVDRTPQHTRYVVDKMGKNPLNSQIRLLKQFMRACGVYGADAKVEGFSGYLAELLIIHYGSFENCIRSAGDWSGIPVIDMESHWSGTDTLIGAFVQANMIVIDPVDRCRNVAAAVSKKSLKRFIQKAKEFIESPDEEFFFPKPKPQRSIKCLKSELKNRKTLVCAVLFGHKRMNANNIYAQLRKTCLNMVKSLENMGFEIMENDIWTNEEKESAIIMEFSRWRLPETLIHVGPPIGVEKQHQKRFLEKYDKESTYVRDGRWVAKIKRAHTQAEGAVKKAVTKGDGFGKAFRKMDDVRVLWGQDIFDEGIGGWIDFLNEYIE